MRSAYLTAVLVLAPALASAQQPCTADADSVVDAVYRQVLERPAGGEGNARAEQLRNGQTTVREIVREIARSPEHAQRFLPANNRTQAVTTLYRHLLARAPDPAGLNDHVQGRESLVALVDTFVNSDEYVRQFGDDTVPGGNRRYCRGGNGPAAYNGYGRTRFQNLDRNGNGVIERDEWNGNRQSFDAQDWNHDGVLSGEELRGGGRRGAREAEANFDPTVPATWTEDTFHQMDRNRDGRLTSSEWFYNADYFRRADRNRDGALTVNEFVNASNNDDRGRWNDNNRDRYDYNSFSSLDANRNGSLSYNEWRWTRSSFDRYDTNRDGVVSRQEFDAAGGAPESR